MPRWNPSNSGQAGRSQYSGYSADRARPTGPGQVARRDVKRPADKGHYPTPGRQRFRGNQLGH